MSDYNNSNGGLPVDRVIAACDRQLSAILADREELRKKYLSESRKGISGWANRNRSDEKILAGAPFDREMEWTMRYAMQESKAMRLKSLAMRLKSLAEAVKKSGGSTIAVSSDDFYAIKGYYE